MATQTKRAPGAAPSRPRRRCWRCPKVRRPNRATQLRLGLGAVAQAVATGRRLQPPVGASASVHQACRPSRREFRLRVVPTTVLDPSATFPAVLRAWSALVFARRRWSVGFCAARPQIRWFFSERPGDGGRHVALDPLCCGEDEHSTAVLSGALLPYPSTTAPAHPPYPSLRIDPAQPHLNSRP